jgi:hypothetical protein
MKMARNLTLDISNFRKSVDGSRIRERKYSGIYVKINPDKYGHGKNSVH